MGGSGNIRAKQQRGAAVRKCKATRKHVAAPGQDSTPLDGALNELNLNDGGPATSVSGQAKKPNPAATASSSTRSLPTTSELSTSHRHLKVILSTATKVLHLVAAENITISEAMPPVPKWFEAGQTICEDVLQRYGGLTASDRRVGEVVDLAVRAREALWDIEEGLRVEGGKGKGKGKEEA